MSEQINGTIRESINNIEPAEGARERMLQNIKRKAAEQTIQEMRETKGTKTSPIMRITKWALPAAACIAIAILGIQAVPSLRSSVDDNRNPVEHANPFEELHAVEEIEKRMEIPLNIPDDLDNVKYFIIDGSIASIDFDYSGISYTLRASKQSGDFSGIFGTPLKTDKIDAANNATLDTIRVDEKNQYKLTWTDGETTYILQNNSIISAEDITEVYEKIK